MESISKITPELLYRCYRTFYNLSNMVVAVAGSFDPAAAERVLAEELKPGKPMKILRRIPEEPRQAAKPSVAEKLDVAIPLFDFGYKLVPEEEPPALLKQQITLGVLSDVLAGPTSSFYEEMSRKGLLDATFDTEVFGERGALALIFGGESRDPLAVCEAFSRMIEEKKREGLSEEEFLSCKNAFYGKTLRALNDVETAASALLSHEMMGVGLFDVLEVIADLSLSDLEAALQTSFDPECRAISLILPKEA